MNHAFSTHHLVDLELLIPSLVIDSKYATNDNFTKKKVYTQAKCYLIKDAKASDELNNLGYTLKIWDAYRPLSVQYLFWSLVPDERYVANPHKGSRHNRGCAIDLTLVDRHGEEVAMGTEFDDFTQKAHRDFTSLPSHELDNRKILQSIMEKNRFIGLETEWWHFDFEDWENYPILDSTFDSLSDSQE